MCRLHKAIYGLSLKQYPRAWFGKFNEIVLKFGLQRCHFDHSVFSHIYLYKRKDFVDSMC